jgi:hypothetical protein
MLSWSGQEHGTAVDLDAVRRDTSARDLGVDAAEELLEFADAATAGHGDDRATLAAARAALNERLGVAAAVDAAAVVANFEMMTRLADGTGARMTAEQLEDRRSVSDALGVSDLTSRR